VYVQVRESFVYADDGLIVAALTVGAVFPTLRTADVTGVPVPPTPSSGVTVQVIESPPTNTFAVRVWLAPTELPLTSQLYVELSLFPSMSVKV
jgi:hypothetical protein